jgi:hypothetical protein
MRSIQNHRERGRSAAQCIGRAVHTACSRLVSAVLRILGKLFCHPLPLDKFGYLCAQGSKHRE